MMHGGLGTISWISRSLFPSRRRSTQDLVSWRRCIWTLLPTLTMGPEFEIPTRPVSRSQKKWLSIFARKHSPGWNPPNLKSKEDSDFGTWWGPELSHFCTERCLINIIIIILPGACCDATLAFWECCVNRVDWTIWSSSSLAGSHEALKEKKIHYPVFSFGRQGVCVWRNDSSVRRYCFE